MDFITGKAGVISDAHAFGRGQALVPGKMGFDGEVAEPGDALRRAFNAVRV